MPHIHFPPSHPCDGYVPQASPSAGAVSWRTGAVAIEAYLVGWLFQLRVIFRAVYIMAVETGDPAPVHDALHEIVSLHPVLVRRPIREMSEAQLSQRVLFQLPIIPKVESHVIADRPIVIGKRFPSTGIHKGTALRMALDAGVARAHVVHSRRIQDIRAGCMLNVEAPRTVASFASHVPLRHSV